MVRGRSKKVSSKRAERAVERVIETPTEDLMDTSFPCVCGQTHEIPMKYLSNRTGAVDEIGEKLREFGMTGKGALMFDLKIADTVVRPIAERLKAQQVDFETFPVGEGDGKVPPEIEWSERIADRVRGKADYLMSAASGVVSDLTKYAAHLLNLPYILIATAPSMNGYTSSMAALTDRGVKQTLLVTPARGIFADIGVLREAPLPMVQAGLGDIVSKSVCNADWKLSQLVKKTYFCPLPFRITDKSEPQYLEAAGDIGRRTEEGIRILSDGVLRSGLSMTVIGTSTPSSGAEHVLSHYWDLLALMEGRDKLLHGVQVGVTTLITLRLYEYVRSYPIRRVSLGELKRAHPSKDECGAWIDRKFGSFADEVRKEYFKKHMGWDVKQRELEKIIDGWDGLWRELEPYLRPIEPVEEALRRSGAAVSFADLGKSRDEATDALLNALFIRGRYTILDLASDLGILQEAGEKIL
jgi:glycerol-1-phosphate dehydrogenase [NAD(P)+]